MEHEILAAGLESLEHDRERRDRAEAKLFQLRADRRATADDRLNIDMTLVGCAQRRGDHREALQRLTRFSPKAGTDAYAAKLQLKATSHYQLGRYAKAAQEFDQLLAADTGTSNDLIAAMRAMAAEIELRTGPYSWPIRLLTASFASWSVRVAADAMAQFRLCYRRAHHELSDAVPLRATGPFS